MTNSNKHQTLAHYRIRLKWRHDETWSDWFEEMAIASKGAERILTGPVVDQAALHGLLIRIRDLNLTLLSLKRIEPFQGDTS